MPEWKLKDCMKLLCVLILLMSSVQQEHLMSILQMCELQKQLLTALLNLKEGLWKCPSLLEQELLQQLLRKAFHIGDSDTQSEKQAVTGSNTKASVDSTNDEAIKGDSEMKDASLPQEGTAASTNQDDPRADSSLMQ